MKKVIALILSLLLIVAFALTAVGCKKAEAPKPAEAPVAAPAETPGSTSSTSAGRQISFIIFRGG